MHLYKEKKLKTIAASSFLDFSIYILQENGRNRLSVPPGVWEKLPSGRIIWTGKALLNSWNILPSLKKTVDWGRVLLWNYRQRHIEIKTNESKGNQETRGRNMKVFVVGGNVNPCCWRGLGLLICVIPVWGRRRNELSWRFCVFYHLCVSSLTW